MTHTHCSGYKPQKRAEILSFLTGFWRQGMINASDISILYCSLGFCTTCAQQKQFKSPQRAVVSAKLEKKELSSSHPVFDEHRAFVISWEYGQLNFSHKMLNL